MVEARRGEADGGGVEVAGRGEREEGDAAG